MPERFTPTRVGKTGCDPRGRGSVSVHPHACGENDYNYTVILQESGSPPRVWGKRGLAWWMVSWRMVHPHACGENASCFSDAGLSCRFTPTRVGKTTYRVRPSASMYGSPPRVWGKLELIWRLPLLTRFTPTRVGKTILSASARARWNGSPPRVWGKHSRYVMPEEEVNGSPPRVWGKRPRKTLATLQSGSPPRVWGKR